MTARKKHYVTVESIINHFNDLEILYEGDIKNKILIPSLNRTGIELARRNVFKNIISAVLWGNNESVFLKSMKSNAEVEEAINNVLKTKPPVIILTNHFKQVKPLLKLAQNYKTVILRSQMSSAQLYITVAA